MLTTWILESFKPFATQINMPIKPVTVLAGLNSSGKSSIIQSMILVSQTLRHPSQDRTLVFNSSQFQLGSYQNIKNEQSDPTTGVMIGFGLHLVRSARRELKPEEYHYDVLSKSIMTAGQPKQGEAPENTRPILESGEFSFSENGKRTQLSLTRMSTAEQKAMLADVCAEHLRILPSSTSELYRVLEQGPGAENVYLTRLSHFLPQKPVRRFNLKDELDSLQKMIAVTIDIVHAAIVPNERPEIDLGEFEPEDIAAKLAFTGSVLDTTCQTKEFEVQLNRIIDNLAIKAQPLRHKDLILPNLFRWISTITAKKSQKKELRKKVVTLLTELTLGRLLGDQARLFGLEGTRQFELMGELVEQVTKFFAERIRYLGPLRADPQAAKGYAASDEPDDVGSHGEYAAARYDANKGNKVQYYNPIDRTLVTDTLETAMHLWIKYLGVAHKLSTHDVGMTGVSFEVQTSETGGIRPLRHVGVGVSQVLPVLVAGLLAPEGTCLLMEQPELHLHARAQARLGDFFYGLTQTGKQCIIETHSDCLIKQLRYFFVRDRKSAEANIGIYFINQGKNGDSIVEPIRISPSGNIVNWPDGFCDESLILEDRIVEASLHHRSGT